MVQLAIDPGLDYPVDVAKINDHATIVEPIGRDFDFDSAIVSVKMTASALIIKETMPVTKMDFLRYLMNNRASRLDQARGSNRTSTSENVIAVQLFCRRFLT